MIYLPRPPYDRVLIFPDREPAKQRDPNDYFANFSQTESGLFVPGQITKDSRTGTVLAVGEGKYLPDGRRQPMTWKPGDRVLYSDFNHVELELNGVKILSMREETVIIGLDLASDDSPEAKVWAELITTARMTAQLEEKKTA